MNKKNIEYHILSDGRHLSYYIYGNQDGEPVFYFHGFPGSHLEVEMNKGDMIAKKMNIKLIAVNRPGYGDSDFLKNRTLLDWPDDIVELADYLDIKKFSVLGLSGGGPYVIVCAYKIPNRIKEAVVVSGMGPIYAPGVKEVPTWSIIRWPGFLQNLILKGMKKIVDTDQEIFLSNMNKSLPEVDLEYIKGPEVQEDFINVLKEALKSGHKGAKQEAKIYKQDWGFDLKEVKHQIFLYHGEKDQNVKIKTAKFIANQLPNCESKFYPNEGHLSLIGNNSLEIFEVFVNN